MKSKNTYRPIKLLLARILVTLAISALFKNTPEDII